MACQQAPQQYFEDSSEIDSSKELIELYHTGKWDEMTSHYADTARIYHNTTNAASIEEAIAAMRETLVFFSDYGFSENTEFEHVITNAGNQWVAWWGVWNGTLRANDQVIRMTVHLSQKYVDGKIVEEFGYWDTQPIFAALDALEEAAEGENDDGGQDND